MGIKHTKVSSKSDSADATKVRPNDWNDDHTVDGDVDFGGFAITNIEDEAYNQTAWNGSLEAPTKNAIRDKIEALVLSGGGVTDFLALDDTPDTYGGSGAEPMGAALRVNLAETSVDFKYSTSEYIDIRDYGTVAGNFGDITDAWKAAIEDYGVGHHLHTIRIPMVDDGIYEVDGHDLRSTYENGQGPWVFELDCISIYLTSSFQITGRMTVRGLRNAPHDVFNSQPAPAPGFYVYDGTDDVCFETWDHVSSTGCSNWLIENVQIGGNITNGTGLHVLGGSLGTIRNCWFSSAGPGWPLHLDTVFWVTLDHVYAEARAAGDYAGIRLSTDTNNPDLACALIRGNQVRLARTGIEFDASGAASSTVSNIEFYDVLCEGMVAGNSLLNFDSVTRSVGQIKIVRPSIADSGGPVYLIKNTAASTRTTSGVEIEGSGVPVEDAASFLLMDPASTHPIDNLTLIDHTNDNWSGGTAPNLAEVYADYPSWGSWTHIFKNSVDAKLACAPVPGANWNYGTPYAVIQDPASWTAVSGAITTGFTGPDGSTMAAKCTGRTKVLNATGQTLALGDWLIAGAWTTGVPGTTGSIVVGSAIGTDPAGGFVFSSDNGTNYDMARDADVIVKGGWRWICQARKVTTAGSNPCTVVLEFNVGGSSNTLYFGPVAMRIPAGTCDDAWAVRIARMLRGGWSSKSPAGSVSILDHQQFWSGKGMAMVDGVTAPSTVSGFAQIYVDTADGDLKVKFGDGTIKTIVVDT